MRLLAWVQARDRNAVVVGAVCGPLLGLGIALATEPPQLVRGGPTGAFVAHPPSSSVVGDTPVGPDDRTTVTASARPPSPKKDPPKRVARTVPTEPTPAPTVQPTPSPTPAPEDCVKGEGEHGDKGAKCGDTEGEPPTAEDGCEIEQPKPTQHVTGPTTQEPPTSSTTEPPVKLCPAPPER